ncbi:MAG: hypothetical protein HC769_27430 [Cyanobacteria bacterium CRU_2_1]|nr:hypothetical protein [Cyanobacteria bacterium CRU_2_1]
MNLAKLVLFSCPAVFASLILVSIPAEASILANPPQADQIVLAATHHAVAVAVAPQSDRPLIPTGCSCARCTKVEDLLQGQFPSF